MVFTEVSNGKAHLLADFNSKNQSFMRNCMAAEIVLSQIPAILVRIVKECVLRPWLEKFKARYGIRKLWSLYPQIQTKMNLSR